MPEPADRRSLLFQVPIRSLDASHREKIATHLLALDERDRYLRFGYRASDAQVRQYVDKLHFERDQVFGIFNRWLELIAMAHLAFSDRPDSAACAEFGVSVSRHARGRGYGARLFDRAVVHARNEGVALLFVHALSENQAMLRIARKAGATLERDGSETEAHLRLPPATLESQVTELVETRLAETDYQLKVQARNFWDFIKGLQEVRQGVRDSRSRSAA